MRTMPAPLDAPSLVPHSAGCYKGDCGGKKDECCCMDKYNNNKKNYKKKVGPHQLGAQQLHRQPRGLQPAL
jgi:hypothetical protein